MQKAIDHMAYSFEAMNTTMERQHDLLYRQERMEQNLFHNLSLTQDDHGRGNYSGRGRHQDQQRMNHSPEQSKLVQDMRNGAINKTKYDERNPVKFDDVVLPEGTKTPSHGHHGDATTEDEDEGEMTTLKDLSGHPETPVTGASGGDHNPQVG